MREMERNNKKGKKSGVEAWRASGKRQEACLTRCKFEGKG